MLNNEPDRALEEHKLGAGHAATNVKHHSEVNGGTGVVLGRGGMEADKGGKLRSRLRHRNGLEFWKGSNCCRMAVVQGRVVGVGSGFERVIIIEVEWFRQGLWVREMVKLEGNPCMVKKVDTGSRIGLAAEASREGGSRGLIGDLFPVGSADGAEVVAMPDARGNAFEMERVRALCCEDGTALPRFHAA